MTLFIDTETSGFYNNKEPPDHPSQPHLVQFAAILDDENQKIKAVINCRVNSGVEEIAQGAQDVHGISVSEAKAFGLPVMVVCSIFANLRKMTSRVVAHNIEFDMNIMAAQFARIEKPFNISEGVFCTMRASSFVLKLPGKFGDYKWPKLSEAYNSLVDDKGFEGAHDAFADVKACRRVYYKLEELGYAS